MRFGPVEASIIAKELGPLLGKGLGDVRESGDETLFDFGDGALFVRTRAEGYRVTVREPQGGARSPMFQHIRGLRLESAEAWPGETVIELLLSGVNPIGERRERRVILEMAGRFGNVVVVGEEGKIICVKYRVKGKSSYRQLVSGKEYAPPPPRKGTVTGSLMELLGVQSYSGELSPGVVRINAELWAVPDVGAGQWETVERTESFGEALEKVLSGTGKPQTPKGTRGLQGKLDRLREEAGKTAARRAEIERAMLEGESGPELADEQAALEIKLEKQRRGEAKLLARIARGGERGPVGGRIEEGPDGSTRLLSPSGFEVLVGRNSRDNERVTFQKASPDDMFFHVKNAPGSHVVLRCGKREPSREDILFAARRALARSRLRHSGKGEVSYTRRKYVRKLKGRVGLVVLQREETVQVRL